MSEIDGIKKSGGIFGKIKDFVKKDVQGEEETPGTWGKDVADFGKKSLAKGAVIGAGLGAGAGLLADIVESGKKPIEYTVKEPVMGQVPLGEIPKDHVTPGVDDAGTWKVDPKDPRKPLPGTGNTIRGWGPVKEDGGLFSGEKVKMSEKTVTETWDSHSRLAYILGGAVIGAIGGTLAAIAINVINKINHPAPPPAWQNGAVPAWDKSAAPAWNNASSPSWDKSAPAWDNTHNKAPWANTHHDTPWHNSHGNAPWHNGHSNSPAWHNSYFDSPWHNAHSNAPSWNNAHSNAPAWSQNVGW